MLLLWQRISKSENIEVFLCKNPLEVINEKGYYKELYFVNKRERPKRVLLIIRTRQEW